MIRKILFIGWYPDASNPIQNVFFRNLIYAMADLGIACTVIAPVKLTRNTAKALAIPEETLEFTPNGNRVRVLHPKILSASAKKLGTFHTGRISEAMFEAGVLRAVHKLNEKFDAVYGHFLLYGGLSAIQVGRRLQIPAFVAYGECSYETEIVRLYGELSRRQVEHLSGIIAVSSKNRRELEEKGIFSGIPITVEPNAVDEQLFYVRDRAECRAQLGIPEDVFLVGFVGSFIERKGDKRLLEAAASLPGIHLAFAGQGSEPPTGAQVLYCRRLAHEDIPIFLNALDVFCLPTRNEGSCNALIEAMACGLPVVSSDLPFNDEVLNCENGIRVNPDSIPEIHDALKWLHEDAALRRRLGANARRTAAELRISARARRILIFMEQNTR